MKKLILLFLLTLSLSFDLQSESLSISPEKRQELIAQLKKYLSQRQPSKGAEKFLKEVTAYAKVLEYTIPATKDAIEKFIAEKGKEFLPEFIQNIRDALKHVKPGIFNKLIYREGGRETWTEVTGSVYNDDNKEIYILYITGVASGVKIIKKERVKDRQCKWWIFKIHKTCKKKWIEKDVPFTTEEIMKIRDALGYAAYVKMIAQLEKIEKK